MDEFFREEEELFERDFDEPPEYAAEVTAFERVGPSGKLAELVSGASLSEMQKKMGREVIPAKDRFLILTDAIARRMNSDNIATISESDINILLEKAVNIPNVQYKNPVAYILGFIASKGGSSLTHTNVMFVINKILPYMANEGSVMPADVIRYARYWKLHL